MHWKGNAKNYDRGKQPMPNTIEEKDWTLLLQRIKDGKCTPFVGAGACYGVLPLGSDVAREWVNEFAYPLKDCDDLVKVAQFLAVQYDPMFPKEKILERLQGAALPDFHAPDEPHAVLADLPLPVYITTNYDEFLVQALKNRDKDPKRELCKWNKYLKDRPSFFDSGFRPTAANPVIFHLHGHNEVPESLVLTEDDYLSFLVNISRDQNLLPPRIQEALAGTSLIFLGYRLADWDFRVLFQGILSSYESTLRRISVTVQLPPGQQELKGYQEKYFGEISKGMRVYWGTAREFAAELRSRWEQFKKEHPK
jgi:hypothetical protein